MIDLRSDSNQSASFLTRKCIYDANLQDHKNGLETGTRTDSDPLAHAYDLILLPGWPSYEYGPFGETIQERYVSNEVRQSLGEGGFRFNSKYQDEETRLYYYGYRFYDASQGRWINRDPLGEAGGLNLYGFVGNDGVNSWDFRGLKKATGGKQSLCDYWNGILLRAILADAAYAVNGVNTLSSGKTFPSTWNKRGIKGKGGLYYTEFTGPNGEKIVGFRGTEITSGADWITNLHQGLGALGSQYSQVYFLNLNLPSNAAVVGHSLGGGLASFFGMNHNLKTTTFNAAGLHSYTVGLSGSSRPSSSHLVDAIYVKGDILSKLQDSTGNWGLKIFGDVGDISPNAVGSRYQLDPDLTDNTPIISMSPTDPMARFLGIATQKLARSVALHSMKETVEAIEKKLKDSGCCIKY